MTNELPVYTNLNWPCATGRISPRSGLPYKGIIYDVTESRLWRNGKHYEHWAGQDLTEELADAPQKKPAF
jgi:predicted heme/steroid binding protein